MVVNANARVGLRKSMNDTIDFVALPNGGPWTITFLGPSPFASGTFVIPAGGSINSGPITYNATSDPTKFRYQVEDSSGTITDDPDVIVES
jgi:hypothetical protein